MDWSKDMGGMGSLKLEPVSGSRVLALAAVTGAQSCCTSAWLYFLAVFLKAGGWLLEHLGVRVGLSSRLRTKGLGCSPQEDRTWYGGKGTDFLRSGCRHGMPEMG